MRRFQESILPVLLIAALAACGGGGGGTTVDSTPSISSLSFAPTSALQGDGNGSITVTGKFHLMTRPAILLRCT
jgi:hypothetical protein